MADNDSDKTVPSDKKDSNDNIDSFMTDDEDDTENKNIIGLNSETCCYQRRGRAMKAPSKTFKNGHVRTKSEGSALFKQDKKYLRKDTNGETHFPDLTNVEMLSHLGHSANENSRRRVQSTSRNRDLSPSEVVRQYITKEKEDMDIMIGRIVHNVEDMAEVAAKKVGAILIILKF